MTIDPNIPDFNKSSFAIKKAERARATIAKYGLPKEKEGKSAKKGNQSCPVSMSKGATKEQLQGITIVHNMRDHSKDPFIIKKVEKARAFIAKHGLPEDDKPKKSK